jgi:hypothetical protein
MRLLIVAAALCVMPLVGLAAPPAKPAARPIEVMVVGVFHMSNPGHDLHNMQVDDVLAPKRQAEIAAIAGALARFKPTRVAVEWPKDIVEERYPKYLAGTLAASHNEVVQLGFRLAKAAGAKGVYGIDVDGDFPYDKVQAYAEAHGRKGVLDALSDDTDRQIAADSRLLANKGLSATLRAMNDPVRLKSGNTFYRTALAIGGGADQPGADLLTAWYRRNFLICANLLQLARPGDRIVVFYGYGHAFLLRQCVTETPGLTLVEPNVYLPK